MNTLTKEWLLKTIAELEEERDATPGAVKEDAALALAAMKIALASLEAEPAIHRWRRVTAEPYGPYPWHYGNFICFSKPVDGIEDEYYYAAPPAPVSVPAAMEMDDDFDSAFEHGKAVGWNAYRAAMLQGADRPQNEPQNIPENIPATQFKPVADLYGLTSPTGGETSFTFDAVEARDFIDGGWSCQEYVELGRFQEAMLQNGSSPAQSDCCPEQNYIAPAQDGDSPVIPDGWVACSERMPGRDYVLAADFSGKQYPANLPNIQIGIYADWFDNGCPCWDEGDGNDLYLKQVTHWAQIPVAPQQEVK